MLGSSQGRRFRRGRHRLDRRRQGHRQGAPGFRTGQGGEAGPEEGSGSAG